MAIRTRLLGSFCWCPTSPGLRDSSSNCHAKTVQDPSTNRMPPLTPTGASTSTASVLESRVVYYHGGFQMFLQTFCQLNLVQHHACVVIVRCSNPRSRRGLTPPLTLASRVRTEPTPFMFVSSQGAGYREPLFFGCGPSKHVWLVA